MNDKAMRAEAVAVANGKIIAVGKRANVMQLRGPKTQLVDLKGQALVPGFVDAHGHIVVGGLQALSANLLAPPDGLVQDIASLQQTLRDWMQKNAAAVEKIKVIVGFGYDNSQLKEQRHPTKEELDAVSQDIPILIIHQSSHLGDCQLRHAESRSATIPTARTRPAASSSANPARPSPMEHLRRQLSSPQFLSSSIASARKG